MESRALRTNLERTDVQVTIPAKYQILREMVKDYPGLLNATDSLLREVHHPFKNWDYIIKETRSYALKNFPLHNYHDRGKEAIDLLLSVFLEALKRTPKEVSQKAAINGFMSYVERILDDGDENLSRYTSVLGRYFLELYKLPPAQFLLLVSNSYQLKKIGQNLLDKMPGDFDYASFNRLFAKYLSKAYEYWLKVDDFGVLFKQEIGDVLENEEHNRVFYPVSHANLKALMFSLKNVQKSGDQRGILKGLLEMPDYAQIVRTYRNMANALATKSPQGKMFLLFKIMETEGLSGIHEDVIREINRSLATIIQSGKTDQLEEFIIKTGTMLARTFVRYPETALNCIQGIGNEIFKRGDKNLVDLFVQQVILIGFQYPEIEGVTDEWQVKANRAHIRNIRVWLESIENNPRWSKGLLSALIINLKLGGLYIRDTDLFQKDITKLLNADIQPVYNLIKQLATLFPVYFNEIGAEGLLRDVSTEMDEISNRADPIIHFLRKQSHVESSNLIVDFVEGIIKFWQTKNKKTLRSFLPESVYQQIKTCGPLTDGVSSVVRTIFKEKELRSVSDLLRLSESDVRATIDAIPDVSAKEKERTRLIIQFYQLLNLKYNLSSQDVRTHLEHAKNLGFPEVDRLVTILSQDDTYDRLKGILDYLKTLKEIILSPEKHEPLEDIYHKRHIAADIPSMYGRYHERKFDALGLTFRLERLANVLFEELISSLSPQFITRATLFQIQKYIELFVQALQLDGISTKRLEKLIELLSEALEVRRFSFSQYIDIFRDFSEAVKHVVTTYYSGVHKDNLRQIILQLRVKNITPKYLKGGRQQSEFEFVNQISECFLREIVAAAFGLQYLDNFIGNVLRTLFNQAEGLDTQNLDLLMSYDPKKALSPIHSPNKLTNDKIHLGNKGYNLVKLASLGIPVPPGFIITTEVFRCQKAINRCSHAQDDLNKRIQDNVDRVEQITGRGFGDPENPLLLSVRSGAAISMPGMMDTFLNVGINENIVQGLIKQTGKPWFAWDSYRRFLQFWGMSFGMERDDFDNIINSFKQKYHVHLKRDFTPEQMREVALAYKAALRGDGIVIIDDPKMQLRTAIDQVFESWFSKKAKAYREILDISDNWGTTVTLQPMVYGNLDSNSGAGVLFTRNPQESGEAVMLWGDFTLEGQGEDVVYGLVKTLPVSNGQKFAEQRISDISLEDGFPEIYDHLLTIAKRLIYKEEWGPQEVEFTFEGKLRENLYVLQARDMAVRERESFMAFLPSKRLSSSYLTRGIGIGGGVISGKAVFDLDEIRAFREKDPDTPLILIRWDTVPDDIRQISLADGLLTARGGSTSHAAIVANRLGKTCVVGCSKLTVWEQEKRCTINGQNIKGGDFLSIDGRNGSVYLGKHKLKEIVARP
jgi:pyruvate,orthophosphate dikinase